jgi:hypothetical protein
MEDVRAAAWMIRYGARSLAHNLDFIPADREQWKPSPEAKSPLEVAAEAVRVFGMYLPMLEEGGFPPFQKGFEPPSSLAEAKSRLLEISERYARALEAAGPELDRAQPMPFGGVFRATRAACFPLLDLMNHHGQILYLQSLLGDAEMHWSDEAIACDFSVPEQQC